MEKRFDLLVVGELNPDLILSGDVIPEFGQVEKLVKDSALTIGSSSAIFACQAARLGLRVAFVGRIGQDEFGYFMLRSLADHNVDTSGVIVDSKERTGFSVILNLGNDRAILTFPGAIPSIKMSDVRSGVIAQARHLHVGSYYLQTVLRPDVPALFDFAHHLGMTTSLDTNYDPDERWDSGLRDALKRADVFLPNATEARAITGKQDLDEALADLAGISGCVTVKMGADGAIARKVDEVARAQALTVQVVDTVGAGDSFDAGFIYGYIKHWSLERSLKLGSVCGSLSTRSFGGTAAQPDLEEAQGYL
ncbi:MAG: carbohydrate kinase family protein [Anaerolineaceae bacterium]|nr:carbohydrate kinase family protein [Anaerolineaceae bacterium]